MADKAFMSFTQNGEQVGLGHSLLVGGDTMEYRALVSDVAKKIIEDYAGSTLAGSAQSVQAALAALNSRIGTVVTANQASTVSINAGSSATILSITPGAGVWVIEGKIRYNDSLTKRRFIRIGEGNNITTETNGVNVAFKSIGSVCTLSVTVVIETTANTQVNLLAFSDEATTATNSYLKAVRIK